MSDFTEEKLPHETSRSTSDTLTLIASCEGFISEATYDAVGVPTIGMVWH